MKSYQMINSKDDCYSDNGEDSNIIEEDKFEESSMILASHLKRVAESSRC